MRKGEETRQAILERAASLASQVGLEGVTIGRLADDLQLSKSGLFAHFNSKEALQIQILRHTAQVFVDRVVRPALRVPRGERRVAGLFDAWLAWARADLLKGGCLFVAAATELDDREGPVRDELVRQQRDWLDLVANVALLTHRTLLPRFGVFIGSEFAAVTAKKGLHGRGRHHHS